MSYMIAALSNILMPLISENVWDPAGLEQLRISVAPFFSPRSGVLVGDEEEIILDCYRLARYYHVSPDVFLSMSISEVELHLRRTAQCSRAQQQATSGDD